MSVRWLRGELARPREYDVNGRGPWGSEYASPGGEHAEGGRGRRGNGMRDGDTRTTLHLCDPEGQEEVCYGTAIRSGQRLVCITANCPHEHKPNQRDDLDRGCYIHQEPSRKRDTHHVPPPLRDGGGSAKGPRTPAGERPTPWSSPHWPGLSRRLKWRMPRRTHCGNKRDSPSLPLRPCGRTSTYPSGGGWNAQAPNARPPRILLGTTRGCPTESTS